MQLNNNITVDNSYEEFEMLASVYGVIYQAPELTTKQILETFMPECLPVIKKNISLLTEKVKEIQPICSENFNNCLDKIYADKEINDQARELFWIPFYQHLVYKRVNDAKIKIEELKKFLYQLKVNTVDTKNPDYDLGKAKSFPLTTFLKINHAGFATCPFHLDKTPSLKVDRHNRFHCFSCGFNGDVVDFYMKENNVDFRTAVYSLNKL